LSERGEAHLDQIDSLWCAGLQKKYTIRQLLILIREKEEA